MWSGMANSGLAPRPKPQSTCTNLAVQNEFLLKIRNFCMQYDRVGGLGFRAFSSLRAIQYQIEIKKTEICFW